MTGELLHGTRFSRFVWVVAGLLLIVFAGLRVLQLLRDSDVRFTTPYQAVLLVNGSVYYGHLRDYGTAHPVLTDVYYVVTQTNSETKQVTNELVKRGKELHGPDRMYINPNEIVFVEPVGISSKVAELISQASR